MQYQNVIGTQVRRRRYRLGWSQSDLARKLQLIGLDLSRSGVSKIEARLRKVTDCEMMFFVRVLKVTHEELYPQVDEGARFSDVYQQLITKKR